MNIENYELNIEHFIPGGYCHLRTIDYNWHIRIYI